MWGKEKSQRAARITTLIGAQSILRGDLHFSGGLHVEGKVIGSVLADDDSRSILTLNESGVIEGEVRVPHVVLNGTVSGDVHSLERIELASKARVKGNVYYRLLEMAIGAEVNGKLVHVEEGGELARASWQEDDTELNPS